ncbi:MAG: hypothetical protein FWC57_05410 [Endomicrobia bacterium]|nr:hypothetical protein [Endomicrobiia bacterium]
MSKKILFSFLAVIMAVSQVFANNLYVIDTPATNLLNYGSYSVGFRAFQGGGVTPRLDFGVFKFLNLGISWELDSLLGNGQIHVAVPALFVKLRLYEGNMTWPGVAIGYDGQGYFYATDSNDYRQKGKGVFLVIGRELFVQNLMINIGVNMNDFKDSRVYGFANAAIPLYSDIVYFMAEYDNINYFPQARLNAGLKLALTDAIDIDFIMRDCWGKDDPGVRYPNERVFKISYTGKF